MPLRLIVFALMLTAACSGPADQQPDSPIKLEELGRQEIATRLEFVRRLDDGPSFTAYLVTYDYAGLKLHAMVAVPEGDVPTSGYPVVIANHGYVPDPRRYGITPEGTDQRPGDYYRSIPELFASRGFLVVMPDYRGHNSSEGFEQTDPQTDVSFQLYGEDVVAMMSGLGDLEGADLDKVFMWSHSMGGIVSMRALLATDIVRASSFWSTMNVDEMSAYYSEIDGPVMLQHAIDDSTTPVGNSKNLAAVLDSIKHPYRVHLYPGSDHLFNASDREKAAERDAEFFRLHGSDANAL